MVNREIMPSLLNLFFMIFFLLESMAAVIQNCFIIIVLSRDWVRCRILPPGDMILASLAISRFFLHGTTVLSNFYACFSPINGSPYIVVFWNFTNMITCWFTTWLAVFYFVKISSFTHPVFLWLKWRISRFVPWLLLCSLLIATLICISCFVKLYLVFRLLNTGNYSEKSTLDDMKYELYWHFFMPLQLFIFLTAFFFFLVSTSFLIAFLCRHLRNMQYHSPQDPSLQVHITNLKSLIFFLILYTSHILLLIMSLTAPVSVCSSHFWLRQVVMYAGISIHPAFLILNSSKLRRALEKMLHDREAA